MMLMILTATTTWVIWCKFSYIPYLTIDHDPAITRTAMLGNFSRRYPLRASHPYLARRAGINWWGEL